MCWKTYWSSRSILTPLTTTCDSNSRAPRATIDKSAKRVTNHPIHDYYLLIFSFLEWVKVLTKLYKKESYIAGKVCEIS